LDWFSALSHQILNHKVRSIYFAQLVFAEVLAHFQASP